MRQELSFVIYFHSSRMDNLKQMIRLLLLREQTLDSELVLVCQDNCHWQPEGFSSVQNVNLNLPSYQKPVLCNRGVEAATKPIIALLDSDRVLPQNWFALASTVVAQNLAVTNKNLLRCIRPYSDHEIQLGAIETHLDAKCTSNTVMRKNGFSGNTVMLRSDYLKTGGMDESFVGYGFADNDMVQNCYYHGINFLFLNDPEIHLFHEKYIVVQDEPQPQSEFRVQALLNGLRFCRKWKKLPNETMINLLKIVREENTNSPLLSEIEKLIAYFKPF